MDISELLRTAAKRGLTHLSLVAENSTDGKTVYWRATATPSTAHKYVSVSGKDPVEAVEQVLKALPKATIRETKASKSTVTVTDPPAAYTPREDQIDFFKLK